jgi:hypothetical protein
MASAAEEKEIEVSEADKQTFFRHIARGEQDQAEAMLKKQPLLALAKGRFDDISDLRCLKKGDEFERVFQNISGWQYAIWAGDIHMCRMIKRCLFEAPNVQDLIKMAKIQYREVRQGGPRSDFDADHHGKAFDLIPLIEAMKIYDKNYHFWSIGQNESYWCKVIGGLQRKLPVYIINEYCRPSSGRPSSGRPSSDWFFARIYDNGKMGESWAAELVMDGVFTVCACSTRVLSVHMKNKKYDFEKENFEVLERLKDSYEQKINQLSEELNVSVKPSVSLLI